MNSEDFFSFVSPANLYTGALIFATISAVFVALIYINLHIKKKHFLSGQKIQAELNDWISNVLVEEPNATQNIEPWLQGYLKEKYQRQTVTDSLINLKKNISGTASGNIIAAYVQLGLKKDSLKKLKSFRPHRKCRGIYELYMMRQQSAISGIARYTNSRNTQVRMEAQTAIVGFFGFKGLSFLTDQTYPLSDWHQLKLLEQLHTVRPEDLPELPVWLDSANNYVKKFALKLADIYQKFEVHDLVVKCLSSTDERVRRQAITTLGRLAGEHTAAVLKKQYTDETPANKRNILRQLAAAGGEEDLPFLIDKLSEADDNLKLEAGKAIVLCCSNGWDVFRANTGSNETLLSISKQIRYELAL